MNPDDEGRLQRIAARLDRLTFVPRDVLADLLTHDGLCMWGFPDTDPPELTGEDTPDRELAARFCAGCPVQTECLELELRLHGEDTTGVWGALPEQDRRALYPLWRERGGRDDQDHNDQEGGPTP